jgi:hypothetical protein
VCGWVWWGVGVGRRRAAPFPRLIFLTSRDLPFPSPPPLLAGWGRNIETPGEDPFHVGEYAINFVKGFEHAPEDPYTLQASACCKHFVGAFVRSLLNVLADR